MQALRSECPAQRELAALRLDCPPGMDADMGVMGLSWGLWFRRWPWLAAGWFLVTGFFTRSPQHLRTSCTCRQLR
jgi:hypothetical protein